MFESVWEISDEALKLELGLEKSEKVSDCSIEIDWGVGQGYSKVACGSLSFSYGAAGKYPIKVRGKGFKFMIKEYESRLIEIKSFGPVEIGERSFYWMKSNPRLPVKDIPLRIFPMHLSGIWQRRCFTEPHLLMVMYQDGMYPMLKIWVLCFTWPRLLMVMYQSGMYHKVGYVNDMFWGASSFNGDVSRWDVSKVRSMRSMFEGASSFNGDVSSWDVSKVTNMDRMFSGSGLSPTNYCKIISNSGFKKFIDKLGIKFACK